MKRKKMKYVSLPMNRKFKIIEEKKVQCYLKRRRKWHNPINEIRRLNVFLFLLLCRLFWMKTNPVTMITFMF